MFEINSVWENEEPLKNICVFLRRGKSPIYSDLKEGPVIINQDCIRWDKIDLSKVKFHSADVSKIKPEFYLQKQDILINSTGTGTIGRVNQWTADEEAVADSHVTIARIDQNKAENRYIRYFLLSEPGQRYLESFCYTGSTNQIELSGRYLRRLKVPLPESKEQKAIAIILSKVDEAIAAVESSIETAERLKKSLVQNLLTGKLKPDGTWRTDDEFYIDEKFGKVPNGWQIKKIKELIKLKNGKANTIANLKENSDDLHIIPVFGGNGITGYFHQPLLNDETLVIGRVGEYCGNVFKTPKKCWVSDNAMFVDKFLIDKYYLDFFLHQFNSLKFTRYSDSTGQPKITQSTIGSLYIIYPIQEIEQKNISLNISKINDLISSKQSKVNALINIKKSLMQNLLTGKKRIDLSRFEALITGDN